MTIPDRLLSVGGGDSTGSKLVESNLRGKQLVDDIRHPASMTNAGDIPVMRVRKTPRSSDETGLTGRLSKHDPAWKHIAELHARRFAPAVEKVRTTGEPGR